MLSSGRGRPQSKTISSMISRIQELESQLHNLGIPIVYPEACHDETPMIGHTRGNTKSNRRVIKRHQEIELTKVIIFLEHLLPDCIDDKVMAKGAEDELELEKYVESITGGSLLNSEVLEFIDDHCCSMLKERNDINRKKMKKKNV